MVQVDVPSRTRLLLVVVFALLVRGGLAYWQFDSFQSDPDAYRAIAETISETGVFGLIDANGEGSPTAFRPPLYPYLLSWISPGGELSLLGVAIFQVFLGTVSVLLTVLISRRLIDRGQVGFSSILAGVLVTIDPTLCKLACQVMTETLATTLTLAVIWWWTKHVNDAAQPTSAGGWTRFALVLSGLLALAYLCRPTFLVWGGCLTLASVGLASNSLSTRLVRGGVVASLVAVTLLCWTYRNARQIGHPVWATSHGGYTLLLANNPSFYEYIRSGNPGEAWDAQPFLEAYQHRYNGDPNTESFWMKDWSKVPANWGTEPITEHEDDQRCYLAARATIDREPRMFVWSCVVRVARLWSPTPHLTPGRSLIKVVVVGVFYSLIYLVMFVTLWRLGRKAFQSQWWPIWGLALTLSAVHAVYWTNMRMRAPIIPVIAMIATGVFVPRTESTETNNDVADDPRNTTT